MDIINTLLEWGGWGFTLILYNVFWAFFISGLFIIVIGRYLKRERAREGAEKN